MKRKSPWNAALKILNRVACAELFISYSVGSSVYLKVFVSHSGAAPLLLLPETIHIRRFNLQTETYHDFLQEEERIIAVDYDWDHNSTGFSKMHKSELQ